MKKTASIIAANRANYYADIDGDTSFPEEMEIAMKDDDMLIDWYANNMYFEDIAPYATLTGTPTPPIPGPNALLSIALT